MNYNFFISYLLLIIDYISNQMILFMYPNYSILQQLLISNILNLRRQQQQKQQQQVNRIRIIEIIKR